VLFSEEGFEEAKSFFGVTQAQIVALPVHQFVTEWSAIDGSHDDRSESYTLNHRGLRRPLKESEKDLFVLERPQDGWVTD